MWVHLVSLGLISGESDPTVAPTGGGANPSTGLYPGYAADRLKEQDKPQETTKAAAPINEVKGISPVYPVTTDRQALRRVVNEAMREKQLQALGQLMTGLQASQAQQQAEQLRLLRVLDHNNNDALIALLLTI